MTSQKDIAKKQAEIVGQLQQFPIGRTNSGGRAGGMVEVVVTNPLPGQPRVVQAKCANDCPPGEVQLLRADDGSYVALSRSAAQKTSETTTRQVSKKNPTIPKKDEEFWPVTSCLLYTRIKGVTEKLTGNGAAQGIEETSWSSMRALSSPSTVSYAYGFAERLDDLGNYKSAEDAVNNKLRPECLIIPAGEGAGFAKDNAVVGSSSQDEITIWFYIGNPADALTNGRIVQVTGPSSHPSNGTISESGPGYCMEVYRGSFAGSVIFPSEAMGIGPLTQNLKQSFPELGGRIGYAGRIERWRGMQDYSTTAYTSFFRSAPSSSEPSQAPTSVPSWYTPSPNLNPWNYTGANWFQFGWPSPQYIGCASTSWINIEMTALNAATSCGASIANNQWYWGGDAAPTRGVLDKSNPSGFIGTTGMFVCWRGHLEHAGMAQSYFEAFRVYWGITGSVTKLGSANPYGCEIPGSGGGYPPAPPSNTQRFLVEAYGRKAKILLVCHKEDYEPIELELPFEYAAVVEELRMLGGGSFGSGTAFEISKSRKFNYTYGYTEIPPFSLELIHATLSIDDKFAYIDIFYGGERLYEEPKTLPLIIELAAQGYGSPMSGPGSNYGADLIDLQMRLGQPPHPEYYNYQYPSGHPQTPAQTGERHPRYVKDCWSRCQSYVVKLPTKNDKTLTIVSSQKYKRGETIAITANNPDNEFNDKFLICDYRIDGISSYLASPNPNYATFGGLPALSQQVFPTNIPNNNIPVDGFFYKNKQDWTKMDWIHYQLQEMPRQYNPLATVLPPNVFAAANFSNSVNIIYDLDKKFGRNARAEKITQAASFGYTGSNIGDSPQYGQNGVQPNFLFISHKEQMIGNGLIKDGILTKWYRVTTSSFPVFGQLLRNKVN